MSTTAPMRFLILAFLAMIACVPMIQMIAEARRGEPPAVLDVLMQPPLPENLRAFERSVQEASVTKRALRPWMQAAQFFTLRDAGEKTLIGREGWLFYQPGIAAQTQRAKAGDSTAKNALAAAVDFRDALAARGIRLIIVPAPNKESIYPDKLTSRATPPDRIASEETRTFFSGCKAAGIETVDLFALFRGSRSIGSPPLYLAQDSHWSPSGMELAAQAVARRIGTPGSVAFDRKPAPIMRHGDLVQMARSHVIESHITPEQIACTQIIRHDTGTPYADDPTSDVLVLGDSFLRIYQTDEPGSAGFIAHLAAALGRPVASIVNDGGASTLVRQQLARKPQSLANAKVVVWEFVERDLRIGTEGWQLIPISER